MFGTFAYNAALGVNAASVDVPAIPDPQTTVQNGHFIFLQQQSLMAAYYLAASATKAQLVAPRFRAIFPPFIRPVERAALPPNRPLYQDLYTMFPRIPQGEEIQVLGSNNLGAATEQSYCLLWIGDGNRSIPTGPIYTANFTCNVTTVLNNYASANITFSQPLPQGQYSIVGMSVVCATGIMARMILPGFANRPGVICEQNDGQYAGDIFRTGYMGEFGRFFNTAQPLVEILANAAGAQPVDGYLELVKVS